MSLFVGGILSFLGGLAIGIIGMFLSDSRYLKNIREIYDSREARYEAIIDKQKETIDRLLEANNQYQIKRTRKQL